MPRSKKEEIIFSTGFGGRLDYWQSLSSLKKLAMPWSITQGHRSINHWVIDLWALRVVKKQTEALSSIEKLALPIKNQDGGKRGHGDRELKTNPSRQSIVRLVG
jgi:hypothetical protein